MPAEHQPHVGGLFNHAVKEIPAAGGVTRRFQIAMQAENRVGVAVLGADCVNPILGLYFVAVGNGEHEDVHISRLEFDVIHVAVENRVLSIGIGIRAVRQIRRVVRHKARDVVVAADGENLHIFRQQRERLNHIIPLIFAVGTANHIPRVHGENRVVFLLRIGNPLRHGAENIVVIGRVFLRIRHPGNGKRRWFGKRRRRRNGRCGRRRRCGRLRRFRGCDGGFSRGRTG